MRRARLLSTFAALLLLALSVHGIGFAAIGAEGAAETASALEMPAERGPSVESPAEEIPTQATALEMALLEATNADRAAHGLPPLEFDLSLLDIARARAAAQTGESGLSHYDERGELAFQNLFREAAVAYSLGGENLAAAPKMLPSLPSLIQRALMKSPTHRQNILEPQFDRLAVGMVVQPSGRVVFAQIFRGG